MKIKRLTIHGFKSFVDKVSLNFSAGTSAVIGPNGCGKSNIVDSIRWVLGEQNARHLRGKHMEDIIFNGSEARKPLGMAEVVLTFSNDSGTAPSKFANFTEIEIARRLYRSGESEYFINKVPSRLRDIVDLFTDTGIGARAYSIIEQGQVGWLINAKPEERRIIFEEAAGINKFKHKKEAALRRLEATKENLTRVSDIISEVKRQLNSLNRQAKKAERYKVIREELKTVELRLAALDFKRLRDRLDELNRQLVETKDREIAAQNQITAQETSADEVKVEHLEADAAFRSVREKVFELEKLIDAEERSSELARMRIDELGRTEGRLAEEIEDLKGSKTGSIELIEHLRGSLSELASTIETESAKLSENSAMLEALVSELKSKEEAERAEKTEMMKTGARLTDIRHSIQTLLRDEENLRARKSRAESEKAEVLRAIASKEAPLEALSARIGDSTGKKSEIEAGLKSVREDLEALETERSGLNSELSGTKDEYSRASAMLATLEEMEKNFENIQGGAKAIMLKGEGGGVRGLIADVIEANPGYEKAVEAVMGDRLQYIIVESQKAGVEAIEYLKANSGGRGSFIPVNDLRGTANPVPTGGVRFSGARELVSEIKIKDGYEKIVNRLLADTVIVENLSDALDIWKNEGLYKTIVTIEGEIIDPQGIITGGAGAAEGTGILQKKNEIKKVRSRAGELEARVASAEARVRETEEKIKSAKAALEDCRERLHAAEIEKVNLESELKREQDEFSRLSTTRDTLTSDLTDAEQRLSGISARKDSLAAERDQLEKALSEREAGLTAITAEIAALAARKEGLNQVVTEIRVTLAQTRERHGSLAKQAAEKERSIEETDKRLELKKAEIERGRLESAEKAEQVASVKERLEGLLADKEGIKTVEVEQAELLDSLSQKIRAIETELKDIKSEYTELQELRGELTIELKETELSIGNLRDKVTEKYSTDIALYRDDEATEEGSSPDMGALEARRTELRDKISALGEVSLSALEEYADLERRHQFLVDQQTDLTSSVDALLNAISRINKTTREKFKTTFDEINSKFQETFPRFFAGGKAELRLSDDGDILDTGIEIVAQPPGKRLQNITLLSGGEKALTATALIFAIFLIKPSPFCLLDEVDAPLDEANIDRFNSFVRDMAQISQFMLITHNKKTMEMADTLYGITMQEPGVSKVISVKF